MREVGSAPPASAHAARPMPGIQRRVIGLFAANLLTLSIVGVSFFAYSRLLSPPEFGLYAVALSSATLLVLVLDGGLKTTIIKTNEPLSSAEEASIAIWMVGVTAVLVAGLVLLENPLFASKPGVMHDAKFVTVFVGTALLFYPFVTLPTAKLERDLRYGEIAWIESLGTIVERAGPALLLVLTKGDIYSFYWALLISRILRTVALLRYHRINLLGVSRAGMQGSLRHVKEGAWIQIGAISSVVRDNLHTLLVGPLCGKEWIGYYAWALQVCLVCSQLFAQISARVSLPLMAREEGFEQRWPRCLFQVRLLTMLTVPMLCAAWLILPRVDAILFKGKWEPALLLIPFLFLRMLAGMATTPLGPLVIVQKGGATFAKANLLWTAAESASAYLCLKLIGPLGLAWSYAIVVWVGLFLLVAALGNQTASLLVRLLKEVIRRPSLIVSLSITMCITLALRGFALSFSSIWPVLVAAGLVIVTSYAAENELRGFLAYAKS